MYAYYTIESGKGNCSPKETATTVTKYVLGIDKITGDLTLKLEFVGKTYLVEFRQFDNSTSTLYDGNGNAQTYVAVNIPIGGKIDMEESTSKTEVIFRYNNKIIAKYIGVNGALYRRSHRSA